MAISSVFTGIIGLVNPNIKLASLKSDLEQDPNNLQLIRNIAETYSNIGDTDNCDAMLQQGFKIASQNDEDVDGYNADLFKRLLVERGVTSTLPNPTADFAPSEGPPKTLPHTTERTGSLVRSQIVNVPEVMNRRR